MIVPKYRRKSSYSKLRRQTGIVLIEGHAMPDPIHRCRGIPPKYGVAHTVGFLKGKSAVRIHRELLRERRVAGLHFWSVGYCVSTVGPDEAAVRRYIREQEQLDRAQGHLDFEYPFHLAPAGPSPCE